MWIWKLGIAKLLIRLWSANYDILKKTEQLKILFKLLVVILRFIKHEILVRNVNSFNWVEIIAESGE